jgi:glycosyltransferase involved in cell wall biosynthesis
MISDFYHPFVGGVEQHVRSLSRALVARGHEVCVATLGDDELPAEDEDGGVRIRRVRGTAQRAAWLFSQVRPWAPPCPDPELTLGLARIVARARPEIVHGHDWLARSFLPLRRRSGARFVVSLHYFTLPCAKKSLMYRGTPCSGPGPVKCLRCAGRHYGAARGGPIVLGNWAAGLAERRAADIFLPVSRVTAEGNGLTRTRLPYQVLPNFLPDESDAPVPDAGFYVAQLPERDYFLFVGDLRRYKGLEVLLKAYATLADAPPLVLIGKVWPETPATFPPNVIVLRDWPNWAVMEAWRRSLVAVVPSIWPEPFGIVVIEALGSGVPVVGSCIGNIPELVDDGVTGLLVPPGDPAALAEALARLARDPALRARMGAAARQRGAAFRAATVVPQFEDVYRRVLHPPATGTGDGVAPDAGE